MKYYENSLAETFRKILAAREAELATALQAGSKKDLADGQADDGEVQDFKDLAYRESQSDMAALDSARTRAELDQVLAAQHRLLEGVFGQCVECSKPIDLRRLQALPAAPLCLACQTAREQTLATGPR